VATPEDVTVWVGLDVGKEAHFADVLDNDGDSLFARAVTNDEAELDALLASAAEHGNSVLTAWPVGRGGRDTCEQCNDERL
jgi:hypothetical protein